MHWSYAHPGNPLVIDTHDILHAYLGGRFAMTQKSV
jgi:hypothetical protein